jgi:hypothetical protein
LGCFQGIEQTLYPRFFPGGGVLFNNPFTGGGIYFLYHVLKSGFRFRSFLLLDQMNHFLCAGSDCAFYSLVPLSAFFTLPVPLFSGFAFIYQKNLLK